MNYGHLHSHTISSVTADLLPQDLGKSAVLLCLEEQPWPRKNIKQKLFIANETTDSLEKKKSLTSILSTQSYSTGLRAIACLLPHGTFTVVQLVPSVILISWIGYLVWQCGFIWIWKRVPAAQWVTHLGKVLEKGSNEEHVRQFRSFSPTLNFPDYRKFFSAGSTPHPPDMCLSAWQDHLCSVVNMLQAVGCSVGF